MGSHSQHDTASTARKWPPRCVHELFEAQVSRSPRATAIIADDELLSYDELNRRSNQLAHHLIALGARPETIVGLWLDRTPATLVAMLAIWKAGAAYLPLDPVFPLDRLETVIAEAQPAFVINPGRQACHLAGAHVVAVASDRPVIERLSAENPITAVCPENLAYCVYTSGTTGTPKGVAVPGSNLVNQTTYLTRALRVQPGDRVLQFTSIAMDAALQEILPAWLGGGTLVLQSERVPSIRAFMRLLDDREVSVVSVPSSYWHLWVDELVRVPAQRPRSLRMVFVGGERILADKLRQWRALRWGTEVQWLADYGPAETTLSCMTYTGPPEDEWENVPLGRPIVNMEIYVLDEELEPVLPAAIGELYIAGVGVARGYLHRPDLTAERFLCNPFGTPGSRMYKTGDLGYELPDGRIQFVGRIDDQVKINGLRVELGDVQSALLRCKGVRDAAVDACEVVPGERRLVGYVVADRFSETEIRTQLGKLLPGGMVPSVLEEVTELHRSPVSGKLDRSKLPLPAARMNDVGPALPTDASQLEQSVAALFAEAIGRPLASRDEDFFVAGGDSLRAVRLLGRLSTLTGVELTFVEFARAPTLRSLASLVATAPRRSCTEIGGMTRRRLSDESGVSRRRASRAQQRLWFLDRLHPGAPVYSIPLAYRIRGALSLDKLNDALTTIVARHEALRTVLVEHDGLLWQEIAPALPIRAQLLQAQDSAEALRLANDAAATPFDLTRGPLFRSSCIRVAADDWLLLLNVHHAMFDVWSLAIFWRELRALYAGLSLSPVAFQYGDYSQWQGEWLQSEEATAQQAFWRDQLAGDLPLLSLNRRMRGDGSTFPRGAIENLLLDREVRREVSGLARRSGTTEFAVLLTAFLTTLYRYTRQEQIIVGVPVACRSRAETEGVIGYFTNTVALRLFFSPGLTFAALLAETSKAVSEAMTRQELPFDSVVDSLVLSRQAQTSPVFQAIFVFQDTPVDEAPALQGLDIEEVVVHSGTAKFDLTCAIRSASSGFTGELEYALGAFDRPNALRFLSSFEHILCDAARRPLVRLDELRMLDAAAQTAIVARSNDHFEVYPDLQLLHAAFEARALHSPEAVAIEVGGAEISYGELNRRANLLACALVAAGAGPERAIGICMERSIELVVSLLATLKAGAAFVPLEPSLPIERMHVIARDAALSSIITTELHRCLLAELPVRLVVELSDERLASGPGVAVSMQNAAFIYYTSGSTGEPKGVVIDHRCATTRLEWLLRRYQLRAGNRVVHKTPLIFDVAIWEIFGPLSAGATILMAGPEAHGDVAEIAELLNRPRTVFTHFVPSMLDAYLSLASPGTYPGLRWVQVSGEATSTRLLERFNAHFTAEFHNMYGQTETSEVAAWEGRTATAHAGVPIGKQIGVYRLFVLDAALEAVPPGVPGELCVAGEGGLARGYHRSPALTAQNFVPHPWALAPGERLYRTGDLVSVDDQGVISWLGRIDQQTKIRGCRVEAGEIEAVLARHPAVRSCAVLACPDEQGANQLVAYVVGAQICMKEVAAYAERFLPSYMHPASYVELDALPLTPSGKLDRRNLPRPTVADREARTGAEAAQTPLERELGNLWKSVLGIDNLGYTDNFFVIGGNSLKSLQVLNRVNAAYGIDVSVRVFMTEPTIRGLASAIEQALAALVASLSDDEAGRRLSKLREDYAWAS